MYLDFTMYRTLLTLFSFWVSFGLAAAEDITGFWKTINEAGEAQSVIAIYPYQSLYYGRLIGTFNDVGVLDDSIYHPVKEAAGVMGHPHYSGLDIIWDLQEKGPSFRGKVMDPSTGKVYNAELWIDGIDLMVRGKLFVFGRNQRWLPATPADFPKDFVMPDPSTFVPVIPVGI